MDRWGGGGGGEIKWGEWGRGTPYKEENEKKMTSKSDAQNTTKERMKNKELRNKKREKWQKDGIKQKK